MVSMWMNVQIVLSFTVVIHRNLNSLESVIFNMKKFYPKKDLSAEVSPVMLQLQRRHTVMEVDNDGKKLKPISRSSSTSSMYKTPNASADGRSAQGVVSPDSASSSTASTVVITESELASSWLYNNKKAQMSSSEALNSGESTTQQRSDKEEMKSPILPRPKVKSNSYSSKRSKCATCCCYLSVILIVCLSAMGILSAVGGIVYMELFTTLNKTQNNPIEAAVKDSEFSEHNDFRGMKKIGHPTAFGEHQKSPEVLKIENRKSEKGIVKFSSNLDLSSDEAQLSDKKADLNNDRELAKVPDERSKANDIPTLQEKDSPSVEESTVAEIINSKSIEEDIAQIIYNISENFNPMKNFLRNKDGSSPYSKLFELYKGIHSSSEKQDSSTEPTGPEIIESSFESVDLSTSPPALFPNDSHMILGSEHEENENKKEPEPESDINSILTIAEEQDPSETDEIKANDAGVASTTPAEVQDPLKIKNESTETKDTPIPMYFFKMPTELVDENDRKKALLNVPDSENIVEEDIAENLEIGDISMGRFLPHIPDFDDSGNFNEHLDVNSETDGEDSDVSIDLNRPITGIAIPKPFNMFNRPPKDNQISASQADLENHDRQFSLAKALERLRMLDTRNIFPTARSASHNKKSVQKAMIGPKKQTDEEMVSERSAYLQTLREKLFDNE